MSVLIFEYVVRCQPCTGSTSFRHFCRKVLTSMPAMHEASPAPFWPVRFRASQLSRPPSHARQLVRIRTNWAYSNRDQLVPSGETTPSHARGLQVLSQGGQMPTDATLARTGLTSRSTDFLGTVHYHPCPLASPREFARTGQRHTPGLTLHPFGWDDFVPANSPSHARGVVRIRTNLAKTHTGKTKDNLGTN